jgi:hypothetical protein
MVIKKRNGGWNPIRIMIRAGNTQHEDYEDSLIRLGRIWDEVILERTRARVIR